MIVREKEVLCVESSHRERRNSGNAQLNQWLIGLAGGNCPGNMFAGGIVRRAPEGGWSDTPTPLHGCQNCPIQPLVGPE